MSLQQAILYFFEAIAALSAIGILFIKNLFKAALLLLLCLVSVAAIYLFASAEFVAVTQVIIYAGGIVVVIIFGIMLTSSISGVALKVTNGNVIAGVTVSLAILALLINSFLKLPITKILPQENNAVTNTGLSLMSNMILPFEITAILLLMALIGAAVISSENKSNK
jgi:NADH:ubiquinone oxidoreductase subunit 6 (subunit J)